MPGDAKTTIKRTIGVLLTAVLIGAVAYFLSGFSFTLTGKDVSLEELSEAYQDASGEDSLIIASDRKTASVTLGSSTYGGALSLVDGWLSVDLSRYEDAPGGDFYVISAELIYWTSENVFLAEADI